MFSLNNAYDRFKLNLRDFLIQLKEFAGDNTELFAEEKEQLERDAKAAERERLSKVGGLLKPAELADDDDELWLEEELRTEYARVEAEDVNPITTHNRCPNPVNNLDGWDMYDLWLFHLHPAVAIASLPGYWSFTLAQLFLWWYTTLSVGVGLREWVDYV